MEPRDTSMPNDALDKTLNEGAASVAADSTNISTPTPEPAETVSSAVAVEEESPVAASSEELSEEVATERSHEPATKESILAALKLLSEKEPAEITNEEVSRLKQQFYAIRNEEQRNEREAFVEAGNQPEAFQPTTDETEEAFKAILATVKEKKAEQRAAIEAEQQKNYERKKEIIDKIIEMGSDVDNANRFFQQVRDLQNEFKEIGEVPAPVAADLWKSYQDAVEKFYDQLKINKELRDYDFKKNLSEKELLVAEADKLRAEEDVIAAFRRLQELHEQWRSIGPVPKEVREEIWGRFKDISAEINKRYQTFFEERKARERENELAKEALCERIESYEFDKLSTYAAWDEMTKLIIAAQEDWKKIGYASRKSNNALFARFRETCDKFFAAKAEFFRGMKDTLSRNLEKKIALCERAEALKDSTEWRKTADELAALQKEWKTIGAVAKKHSDQVWRRFLAACDYFFEQKKKNNSGTRRTERANLEQKNEIIDKLKALDLETLGRENAIKAVKDLQAEWQSVGHVPFSEKDNIYEAYRAVVNELYQKLDISQRGSRMASFENTINEIGNDENRLYRERERLMRVYEQRRSELQTYENNMGFLSAKSKNAGSMLKDMERRMQRLKDDIADLEKKIAVIDSKL
ncbi:MULTISPECIES: DUF349 domain-containing protein [Duncaniella]|uniref:DUF349 domain-containing protein n=1 Tax=Duncaniella dubosii TaxID=2518971 RepID=A0A4P7W1A0_9BACT|nr:MULTISPECIES: DUF349 domain-containing protein [Duncaniella]MBJ2189911.1 DUF349 domain-containing protein [Muribaculaceae bacterium]QCD41567.1 DUF349 domain-containing protein [Duncaniella dubosii]